MTEEKKWYCGEWGHYGGMPPCDHLKALRSCLESNGLSVWSEHDEWVNVHCARCGRTYETTLDMGKELCE